MLRAASFSALTLLRSVRELADDTERRGGDWRETITLIRNLAPQLWQRLPAREKRRMLRHIRPYWDIHRHRLPSQTLARMHHLRRHEKLNIHAGRLMQFELVPARRPKAPPRRWLPLQQVPLGLLTAPKRALQVRPRLPDTRTKVRVTWRPRGSDEPRTMLVDRVINCTGPDYNIRRSQDPLMRSLLARASP